MSVPAWVDRDLYPFHSAVCELAGHRVHYVDEGHGPVLLMLHGNPTWSFVYRDVISRLAGEFRCVAPDLPGFGLSQVPDGFDGRPESMAAVLEELVVALDLREVVLVMQDWGGPIGLHLSARLSGRVRGLVIGNTWAWPVTGNRHFEWFSRVMGGQLGAFLTRHVNLFVNVMIPVGHRRRRLTRAEMHHYRAALDTPARRQASAILPREIVDSADFLARVEATLPARRSTPALLVWADRDIAFGAPELARWHEELPEATVVGLPGAGHFLQSDAPEEFAEAIRTWHGATFGTGR